MDVELQYFDGCPNWHEALESLQEALSRTGHDDVPVRLHQIETHEAAIGVGFLGSPTFLIDGIDPFASGAGAPGLSCRMYATPTGLAGCPSIDDLVAALG